MAFPELIKGVVQTTEAGIPSFSITMPSSTLPELQEPQSPIPATTTWALWASSSAAARGMA